MGKTVSSGDRRITGKVVPLENSIVRHILMSFSSMFPESYFFKTHGNQFQTGQPDILGSHKGRAVAIEVKRPGRKPTEVQTYVLSRWLAAGAVVGCAHDLEEALGIIGEPLPNSPSEK